MPERKTLGVALIIMGVLANNYVYLHDIIFGAGVTELGPKSIPSIIISGRGHDRISWMSAGSCSISRFSPFP